MEREMIIKALECRSEEMICAIVENKRTHFVTNATVLSLIKELTEENDRLSTALAEYEHKTNIRISEEYVHNEAYEELMEKNKKLIEEAENYKKIAEYQQSSNMNRGFKIKRLNEEIERLQIECEKQRILWKQHFEPIYETAKETVKADTVREMQEKVKSLLKTDYINGTREHAISVIDQIAKEMLEGNDERE